MNADLPVSHTAATAATDSARRSVLLLVAAGVLVIATVVAVIVFGVVRPPAVDVLSVGAPPGAVAWNQWDGDRQCVMTASPSGEVAKVACDRDYADLVGWTDEGIIVHRWQATGSEIVLDPATGGVLDRRPIPDDREPIYTGNAISSYHEDGMRVVEDAETRQVLWRVEIASVYDVHGGTVSPDGRWIAAGDSSRRLLLFDRESDQGPQLWASDVDAGWSVIWQGSDRTESVG